MKRTKKIIASFLAVAMLAAMGTNVFASEITGDDSKLPVAEQNITFEQSTADFDDVLNENFRSTSVPTQFFDLSTQGYHANLEYVNVSWLYTNYYFKSNANGKININIQVFSDTGRPTKMKVGLYDMSQRKFVTSFTSGGSTIEGISENWQFINLNVNTNYAIAFTAVHDGFSRDSVRGTAFITQ